MAKIIQREDKHGHLINGDDLGPYDGYKDGVEVHLKGDIGVEMRRPDLVPEIEFHPPFEKVGPGDVRFGEKPLLRRNQTHKWYTPAKFFVLAFLGLIKKRNEK